MFPQNKGAEDNISCSLWLYSSPVWSDSGWAVGVQKADQGGNLCFAGSAPEVPAPLNIFLGSEERKQLSQDLANCGQSQTPESSLTRFSLVHASTCPCLLESQLSSEFETWLWSNNFETLYVKIDSPVGIKTNICFLSSTFQWRRDVGGRVERSTKVCVGCLAPLPHSLHTYGLLPAFHPLFQPPDPLLLRCEGLTRNQASWFFHVASTWLGLWGKVLPS